MADLSDVLAGAALRGLTLLGCGKMGGALLEGWLDGGFPVDSVTVLDPAPSPWLQRLAGRGLHLNPERSGPAAVCVVAVKPQIMDEALPAVTRLAGTGTLFVSIAAGTPISRFEAALGAETPIVRAMPNTPAAVGRGVTALVGNAAATEEHMRLAEALASAVGVTVRLEREEQMDAVTAVSGSGPAYVFHLIEAMAAAAQAEGLPEEMAVTLARETVCGAGELAAQSPDDPGQLRANVTSPGGTTAAALEVLMAEGAGLRELMARAVHAAAQRSRELGA